MSFSVETKSLTRIFKHRSKEFKALDNITITVPKHVIYGLLGPNGAGKTTLIRILTTLLLPSSGKAFVDGYDVVNQADKVRKIINLVSGGERPGYGILTVRENLLYFAQVYGLTWREAEGKIEYLNDLINISSFIDKRLNSISTGMLQKYSLARGLLNNPRILFLDEPTLGLDIENAHKIRGVIKELVSEKSIETVFLTSHYMAEVEELCDVISIINDGRLIVTGTPEELKRLVKDEIIYNIDVRSIDVDRLRILRRLDNILGYSVRVKQFSGEARVRVVMNEEEVLSIMRSLEEEGVKVIRVYRDEVSLEDVFLKLIGKDINKEE